MSIEPFLVSLGESAPSGTELRNDARFHAIKLRLEDASRKARTDADGNVNILDNVDWTSILDEAVELSATGRDLRLLVIVARAMANVDGFSGLAAGLDLISKSLDGFWDSIHPELRDRPNPADAALRRINALKQLENSDNGVLGDLRMGATLTPRGIGPITGQDLANGSLSEFQFMSEAPQGLGVAEKEALKADHAERTNRVKAACRALVAEEPERAANLVAAISAADDARERMEQIFTKKAGFQNGAGLHLNELQTFLGRIRAPLDAAIAESAGGEEVTNAAPESARSNAVNQRAAPSDESVSGKVNSRRDVERCLDMIIAFYERTEPASPIPHLARRMRRMVPMDFLQLMEEIAPSGIKEFKNIAGVGDEKRK